MAGIAKEELPHQQLHAKKYVEMGLTLVLKFAMMEILFLAMAAHLIVKL